MELTGRERIESMRARTHRETAAILLVICYVSAIVFFAFVRMLGLIWFKQEYVETSMPLWAGHVLMSAFWMFDGVIKIKTLSRATWKSAIFIIVPLRIVPYLVLPLAPIVIMSIEFFILIGVPFILNKDKERSIGYSVLYVVAISIYQGLMMLGRGYPMLAKFSPSWQILLTIDYRLFLFGLFLMKGVIIMPSGCWLFIGPFDSLAQKIGKAALRPFSRLLR